MHAKLLFECDCQNMNGWKISGTHSRECVSVGKDYIRLLDDSSFKDCCISRNIGSIPDSFTFQIELRLAQLIDLVIDPSKRGCEVVWCHQIIYIANTAGNSFSLNFSKDGLWVFYNPSDRSAGPGGKLVKIPDTAKFLNQDWHVWTFYVNARDSIDDDYCDIYRDGELVARRIMAHNHEFSDGTLIICNRGIEQNPAEMHIRRIKVWEGFTEKAVSVRNGKRKKEAR